jgi:hypothetical protein
VIFQNHHSLSLKTSIKRLKATLFSPKNIISKEDIVAKADANIARTALTKRLEKSIQNQSLNQQRSFANEAFKM